MNATSRRARYVMIGGFLGAGKTTAVLALARHLQAQGLRVGLITNDQGTGLVDSLTLRAGGFPVEEIGGGCFCCRFDSLRQAAGRLTAEARPDVFIAEPVGSCTDLVATVAYPLRRLYGDDFAIAPLSVLVDPLRAERMLGLESGPRFSAKVAYIYLKQLEEADLIVVNKRDLLTAARLEALCAALSARFPRATVLACSARDGAGLDAWFARLAVAEQPAGSAMAVDYDLYAEGEALLGWLNATVAVAGTQAGRDIDGNRLVADLAGALQRALAAAGAQVAHLKMTLAPQGGVADLATINLVRDGQVPELGQALMERLERGQLVINLRAETAPEVLRAALAAALAEVAGADRGRGAATLSLEHLEAFMPGRPVPTHRFASATPHP